MFRTIVILVALSLFSFNAHAAKGGRWDGANSGPGNGATKSKKNKHQSTVDSTAPVLALPADLRLSATSATGATVVYSASAEDDVDGTVAINCSPQSGQEFPLGTGTVNCSAYDRAGNTSNGSFPVTVVDDNPPSISVPPSIAQSSVNGESVAINYAEYGVTAVDLVDSQISFTCVPESGSLFAVGTTSVVCTAVDDALNEASASFAVVIDVDTPPPVYTAPDVAFALPAPNTILQAGESLSIAVQASDRDGSIQNCSLYQNGNFVRQENLAPYEWGHEAEDASLKNLSEGVYQFSASCTDNDNLQSSATLTVLVEAAPEPVLANILLDWVVPSTREDGSNLPTSEIDSYEIYYYLAGNSNAGTSLNVPSLNETGNLVTSYQINSLDEGSYYFSIATIDTGGNVSEFVQPVGLVVN